jgi:hypothetical protein
MHSGHRSERTESDRLRSRVTLALGGFSRQFQGQQGCSLVYSPQMPSKTRIACRLHWERVVGVKGKLPINTSGAQRGRRGACRHDDTPAVFPHLRNPTDLSHLPRPFQHASNMSSMRSDNSSLPPSNYTDSSENLVCESLKEHLALTPLSALLPRTPQRSSCAVDHGTGGADPSSVMSGGSVGDGNQTAVSSEPWYSEFT